MIDHLRPICMCIIKAIWPPGVEEPNNQSNQTTVKLPH